MPEQPENARDFASPPCAAHEVDPACDAQSAPGSQQPEDVARWRRAERTRLRAARQALAVGAREVIQSSLASHVWSYLENHFGDRQPVLSGYWPIKGEPDLREILAELHARGWTIALPVVEVKAAPLVFRLWTPGMRMTRGDWNIPVPPPDVPKLVPEVALAPLVGWDDAGYRLGYGGGYFDRTLAALTPRPFAIGVGLQAAHLATIHPQPHDIPLDVIVTEAGVQVESGAAK